MADEQPLQAQMSAHREQIARLTGYEPVEALTEYALSSFVSWLLTLVRRLENVLFENENQYAWKDSTLATVAK